ncbi:hypothetical protein BDB01DRAFT_854691 [Pilobolus umbonatus]|nr:hypothetical protein BDB01DRAFT_854691 [Pilobolus umbonatus]
MLNRPIKRVGIIGAGPGGLAAAMALKNEGTYDTITIYERHDQVGGTWIYSPETDTPPTFPSTQALQADVGTHSPIYEHLHTNLPNSVMCFRDIPFPKETPYFPSHRHVLDYLVDVAHKKQLYPHIRFAHRVDCVDYIDTRWRVTATHLNTKETSIDEYDAIVVATGHYTVPYVPDIPGLSDIKKHVQLMHSRDYRKPDSFSEKTVLVIGGGSSSTDIVREIAPIASKVYQSIRGQSELIRQAVQRYPENVEVMRVVKQFSMQGSKMTVEFEDGKQIKDIDTVVFGTGYLYSFPFLPFQKDNLIVTGQKVHHLDHHMFYQKNRTLCFLGLPIRIVPFPLMQVQAVVMARYWNGKIPMVPDDRPESSGDDRSDLVMNVSVECDYVNKMADWARQKGSDDPVTARLSDQWILLRKNALNLRKEYLGY